MLILGPSGSGKTTLLSLFGCVIYPSYGEVWIDGIKVNELSEKNWLKYGLKNWFVFQKFINCSTYCTRKCNDAPDTARCRRKEAKKKQPMHWKK